MNVYMMRHTAEPDLLCGEAAALCTNFKGDPIQALRGALASGHESVAEHASFTFLVEGVSRLLLAQLTRHRLASFSVQSQRYAGLADNQCLMPESMDEQWFSAELNDLMQCQILAYHKLVENYGIPEEDARFILPQGITTKLIMTMNARELRHFFGLRCCNRAQWEIRQMADKMLTECCQVAPVLFEDAGPGCVRGACPEKKPCGKPQNTKEWNA